MRLAAFAARYSPGFKVQKKNSHKHGNGSPATEQERAQLAALMPMDMWLYDHAVATHNAKWAAYEQLSKAGQLTPGTALLGKERCPAPAVRTSRPNCPVRKRR